jgi:hypothetical protein
MKGITHLLGDSQFNICKCDLEGELYSIFLDATKYKSWSEKCVNPKVRGGCRVWHIVRNSLLGWIRSEGKYVKNATNHCRALISSFAVLGDHSAWKFGDGTKIRIGADEIMGCAKRIFLPLDKIQYFQDGGLVYLNQVVDEMTTDIWEQGWKYSIQVDLEGDLAILWNDYLSALRRGHAKLREDVDNITLNKSVGYYTARPAKIWTRFLDQLR